MKSYVVNAKVDQIVTREVQLVVVGAVSKEEAEAKAREALQQYPQPVKVDGVSKMLTTKATYWIPKSIDLTTKEAANNEND